VLCNGTALFPGRMLGGSDQSVAGLDLRAQDRFRVQNHLPGGLHPAGIEVSRFHRPRPVLHLGQVRQIWDGG